MGQTKFTIISERRKAECSSLQSGLPDLLFVEYAIHPGYRTFLQLWNLFEYHLHLLGVDLLALSSNAFPFLPYFGYNSDKINVIF